MDLMLCMFTFLDSAELVFIAFDLKHTSGRDQIQLHKFSESRFL